MNLLAFGDPRVAGMGRPPKGAKHSAGQGRYCPAAPGKPLKAKENC
jgi:hypothetical protein